MVIEDINQCDEPSYFGKPLQCVKERERERESKREYHVHMLYIKCTHTHLQTNTQYICYISNADKHADFESEDTGYLVEDHCVERPGDGQEIGCTGGGATELGEVKGRHPCRRLLHLKRKHTHMCYVHGKVWTPGTPLNPKP